MNVPHEALRITDILDHICAHTESKADLCRLAQISRCWFDSAIPRLWDRAIDFNYLLKLIPGATLGSAKPKINPNFPSQLDHSIFERISIYAPWTTTVVFRLRRASEVPSAEEQIRAMHEILRYTAGHTLFRRLHTLRMKENSFDENYLAGVHWLFLLVSSSIKQLEITSYSRPVAPTHMRILQVLVGLLLKTCLQLEHLKFNVQPRGLNNLDDLIELNFSNLPALTSLSDMSITLDTLDPTTIQWMSTMPHLRSLDVDISSSLSTPVPSPAVPTISGFCRLRKIRARIRAVNSFSDVWESLFVQSLTEASISFALIPGNVIYNIGRLLPNRSPNLTTLSIWYLGTCNDHLPLKLLQPLPLIHLGLHQSFSRRHITPNGSSGDILEIIGGFWPKLKTLAIDRCQLTWQELLKVSLRLPCLESFCFTLPPDPPIEGIDIPVRPLVHSWPNNPPCVKIILDSQRHFYSSAELDHIGLTLSMAWPNMTIDHVYPENNAVLDITIVQTAIQKYSKQFLSSAGP